MAAAPAQCEYAVAPFPRTRLSAIVRDQTARGERVALALAVSEMQNAIAVTAKQRERRQRNKNAIACNQAARLG